MREWRKTHPLTSEAKRRADARNYAGVYLRRGHLTKQPCEACGSPDSEMHHDDYSRPLDVHWLCRRCHLAEHEIFPAADASPARGVAPPRRRTPSGPPDRS